MIIPYIAAAAAIIAADQAIKLSAAAYLKPISSMEIIQGILSFTYVENRGAAFGMMQDSRWIFITATILIIIAAIAYTAVKRPKNHLLLTSITLVVSGGFGNLIDRIFKGYVIDMIEITFIDYPVFNFADCCVVIGAILLCIYVFTSEEKKKN